MRLVESGTPRNTQTASVDTLMFSCRSPSCYRSEKERVMDEPEVTKNSIPMAFFESSNIIDAVSHHPKGFILKSADGAEWVSRGDGFYDRKDAHAKAR